MSATTVVRPKVDKRLCNLAHDANGTTAVYQFHVVVMEGLGQFAGGSEVSRRVAARGTAAVQKASDMALDLVGGT
jgi:hypothetical protein